MTFYVLFYYFIQTKKIGHYTTYFHDGYNTTLQQTIFGIM
jgi:hypothetical protein